MIKFVIAIITIFVIGCDKQEKVIEDDSNSSQCDSSKFDLEITFTFSIGFVGGSGGFQIDSNGLATVGSISQNVSCTDQASLKNLADEFFAVAPDSFPGGCGDDNSYIISITNNTHSKTVYIEGCAIYHETAPSILDSLVSILWRVMQTTAAAAPWTGLKNSASINTTIADTNEPIRLKITINNPLDIERRFYVYDTTNFRFTVGIFTNLVNYNQARNEYKLMPGEKRDFEMTWYQTLPIGHYIMSNIGMPSTISADTALHFEILDKTIPISGIVLPDYGDSATYVFQIDVYNWSQNSVTLHYDYLEKINIALYSLDGPANVPPPLVFSGPSSRTSQPESVTLSTGQHIIYRYAVPRSQLPNNHSFNMLKIQLLCTDFTFERIVNVHI